MKDAGLCPWRGNSSVVGFFDESGERYMFQAEDIFGRILGTIRKGRLVKGKRPTSPAA